MEGLIPVRSSTGSGDLPPRESLLSAKAGIDAKRETVETSGLTGGATIGDLGSLCALDD